MIYETTPFQVNCLHENIALHFIQTHTFNFKEALQCFHIIAIVTDKLKIMEQINDKQLKTKHHAYAQSHVLVMPGRDARK